MGMFKIHKENCYEMFGAKNIVGRRWQLLLQYKCTW